MNIPEAFRQQMTEILTAEESERFFAALQEEPTVSVRRNTRKINVSEDKENQVKWCEAGSYLAERDSFTFDPFLHAGLYYVQDASSMILRHIATLLSNGEDVRYLDLCAAPGGKTTAALDALSDGSLVVANEYVASRAGALRENVIKWGAPNCVVTNNDSAVIGELSHYFDIIAADVPCSGEGMFRKDEEAVKQWTPDLVAQCAARQREIIDNVWEALRPGGYLIYSTCTYNREEDEEMVQYIKEKYNATSVDLNFPAEWGVREGIDTENHCYRFMPHCVKGEGLFVSVLQKNDDEAVSSVSQLMRKKKKGAAKARNTVPREVKEMVENQGIYEFSLFPEQVVAHPKRYAEEIEMLYSRLKVIYAGLKVAEVKGKDIVPSQALALSSVFNKTSVTVSDIDYKTAIAYLRGESITLDCAKKGIVAVAYNGVILGFVKNLGNRANNLYPKEWRIKSTYVPDNPPAII